MRKEDAIKVIDGIQIVLYLLFLFLWFISPKVPALRLVSIVLLACFSVIQIAKIFKRKNICINIDKPIMLYVLFAFWCFLSIIWAQDRAIAIERVIDVVLNSLFLIFSYDFFSEIRISKKTFISIFIIVGLLLSFYIFCFYGLNRYFQLLLAGRRVGGSIINVNFIGLVSSMTIIMLVYSVLNRIYHNKLILLLIIPLLITTLGSGSRKALIGLIIGVALVFILYLKGRLTRKKVAIFLLSSVLLIGSFFAIGMTPYSDTLLKRMDAMFATLNEDSSTEEGSTRTRLAYAEGGFNTFLEHPLIGIGLNNSKIITKEISGAETYLHNNYIELLACLGAVGFIIYYSIYLVVISKGISLNKKLKRKQYLPIIMAITLLIVEIGCVSYYEIKTSMYFIIMFILTDKTNWKGDYSVESENEDE